jgi:lysozyme
MAQLGAILGFALILFAAGLIGGCGQRTYPSADTLTPGIFLEPPERAVLPPGVSLRPVYDKGLRLTKVSEGFRSELYNDAARYCSIAYGHLVKRQPCDGAEPEEFLNGITEPRGSELLVSDMERAQVTVMTAVEPELTDGQYAALCDFVYNVGSGNFRSSTLRKVVNARQYDRVPSQLGRWVKAGGKEWPGLKTRREREIELFFEGIGMPRAAPPAGEVLSPVDIREGEAGT